MTYRRHTFDIPEHLWLALETMAGDMGQTPETLFSQAIFQLARVNGYTIPSSLTSLEDVSVVNTHPEPGPIDLEANTSLSSASNDPGIELTPDEPEISEGSAQDPYVEAPPSRQHKLNGTDDWADEDDDFEDDDFEDASVEEQKWADAEKEDSPQAAAGDPDLESTLFGDTDFSDPEGSAHSHSEPSQVNDGPDAVQESENDPTAPEEEENLGEGEPNVGDASELGTIAQLEADAAAEKQRTGTLSDASILLSGLLNQEEEQSSAHIKVNENFGENDADEDDYEFGDSTVITGPPAMTQTSHLQLHAEGETINVSGEHFTIGRGQECDLVIPKQLASRVHAIISREENHFILVDQSSRNGTWIDGERIERHHLNDGDIFEIGGLHVKAVIHR